MKKQRLYKTLMALTNAVLISAAASALAAGNGGGYGGGEISGSSVPLRLNFGVTLGAAKEAVKICMFTGDKSTGRVSVVQKFITAVYGGQSSVEDAKFDIMNENTKGVFRVYGKARIWAAFPTGSAPSWLTVEQGQDLNNNRNDSTRFLLLEFPNPDDVGPRSDPARYRMVQVITREPFPTLEADEITEVYTPNKWGLVNLDGTLLKGLKIAFANTTSVQMKLYPMDSRAGSRAIPITINAAEYVQCLEHELQKRASN